MSGSIQKQTRKNGVHTSKRNQSSRTVTTDLKIPQFSLSPSIETSTRVEDRNYIKQIRKDDSCDTATNGSITNFNGKLNYGKC